MDVENLFLPAPPNFWSPLAQMYTSEHETKKINI